MLQSHPTVWIHIFSALSQTKGKLIEHLWGSGGVLGQGVDLWGAERSWASQVSGTQRREKMHKS